MKIMSFNTQHCLNYITNKIDFDVMAKAILDCDADIVGLNEIRGLGPDPEYTAQMETLAQLTGMKYYYFGKAIDLAQGPYGNGFLSKIPIVSIKTVIIPDPVLKRTGRFYETRGVIVAELEGGVTVLVTHVGLTPEEAQNAIRVLRENVAAEKCVVMGDFNMTPDDSIIAPMFEIMKDAAEGFCADKLSFPSDKPGCKIDYIFVSRDVKVTWADIPAIVASDHRPHLACVEF